MLTIPIDEYKDAMRESICSVCVSFAPNLEDQSRCVYETTGQCTLFAHLEDVVESVTGVSSDSIETYVTALRQEVCANCDHQNSKGICDLRDSRGPVPIWCPLDTYFNLIVGAVEDVQKQHS